MRGCRKDLGSITRSAEKFLVHLWVGVEKVPGSIMSRNLTKYLNLFLQIPSWSGWGLFSTPSDKHITLITSIFVDCNKKWKKISGRSQSNKLIAFFILISLWLLQRNDGPIISLLSIMAIQHKDNPIRGNLPFHLNVLGAHISYGHQTSYH